MGYPAHDRVRMDLGRDGGRALGDVSDLLALYQSQAAMIEALPALGAANVCLPTTSCC